MFQQIIQKQICVQEKDVFKLLILNTCVMFKNYKARHTLYKTRFRKLR